MSGAKKPGNDHNDDDDDDNDTGDTRKKHREVLPASAVKADVNVLSVLKNCIGKELTKITMPIYLNEPLSFLQRISEYMEYSNLLNLAAECTDSLSRMQYVIAFAVSSLSSSFGRLGKPFNPLLGETFEITRDNYRFLSEQTCHHPPVSAFYAESIRSGGSHDDAAADDDGREQSSSWSFFGSISPRLKFLGKSVEIHPKGSVSVFFSRWNEVYSWENIVCCIHNVTVGKLWMEQYGSMKIANPSNKLQCMLHFKESKNNLADLNRVDGFITDELNQKLSYIFGKWPEYVNVIDYKSFCEQVFETGGSGSGSGGRDSHVQANSANSDEGDNANQKIRKNRLLSKLNSFRISTNSSDSFLRKISQSVDCESIEDSVKSFGPENLTNYTNLWKCESRFTYSDQYYHFSKFAMTLNEIDTNRAEKICKTDSRLRPDIRKFEEGAIDEASKEKDRLEHKQRKVHKQRKENKIEYEPRWFKLTKNPHTNQNEWTFTGDYWKRNFENIPDIF